MAIKDSGIRNIQKLLRGTSSVIPISFVIGEDENIDPSEGSIETPHLLKEISWSESGLNSVFSTEISTLEGNGTDIKTYALTDSENMGEGEEWFIGEAPIGLKTDLFAILISGEVVIRRPI